MYLVKGIGSIYSIYTYFKDNGLKINDMDLQKDVVSKLKFIGLINKGDKLNVKNFTVQPDNVITKINRSFINLDNRQNSLQFVETTVQKAFQILKLSLVSDKISDKILCMNILQDIIKSKQGISNLCETYQNDVMITCNFATILQDIDARLAEIRNIHPDLFKDIENGVISLEQKEKLI